MCDFNFCPFQTLLSITNTLLTVKLAHFSKWVIFPHFLNFKPGHKNFTLPTNTTHAHTRHITAARFRKWNRIRNLWKGKSYFCKPYPTFQNTCCNPTLASTCCNTTFVNASCNPTSKHTGCVHKKRKTRPWLPVPGRGCRQSCSGRLWLLHAVPSHCLVLSTAYWGPVQSTENAAHRTWAWLPVWPDVQIIGSSGWKKSEACTLKLHHKQISRHSTSKVQKDSKKQSKTCRNLLSR